MNQPANAGPGQAAQTAQQEIGKTADQARQAAGEVVSTAGEHYLERHGAEGLVSEVQDFACRRPGLFLGGALLAGFGTARLAKAGMAAGNGGAGSTPGTDRAPVPDDRMRAGAQQETPGYPYEPAASNPPLSTPSPEL